MTPAGLKVALPCRRNGLNCILGKTGTDKPAEMAAYLPPPGCLSCGALVI